ncbi:MAG: integrase core domain-containing protein [Lentisphaeria bacterium]|nr:integrase core domain-containing protein [Lentisphaeria bacterium]
MQKKTDTFNIQGEIIEELTGSRQPELSVEQKKRLAHRGKKLNEFLLGQIENTFAPSTVFKWYSELISKKYDSTGENQKKRGRKPISNEIVAEALRLANNNPSWGYDRIAGVMKYLGYDVSVSTVRNVLNAHGIVPDPERRRCGDWHQFIETQQFVTAATDYATVELVTEYGLERRHLLFFMDIGTREVRLGGIVKDPNDNWSTQIARNMCDMWDGFLLGKRYLIHDRNVTFTRRFDAVFESIGIEVKKLPPFMPMMNSRIEKFNRALKTECLDKIIFTNEQQLRFAVKEYLEYWNHYRPHAGLNGNMVLPYPQDADGEIQEISFLGGLLHGYRRVQQAA